MQTLNIIIVISNDAYSVKLKNFLLEAGFNVLDVVRDGNECLRKVRAFKPDLVIIDYDISPNNGYNLARLIEEDNLCGGIIILSEAQKSLIQDDFNLVKFVYITKPLNKNLLLTTIELINRSTRKILELEKEVKTLKITLETRKDIEKAKGILMDIHNINEQEAFRRMQKQSMDSGISMKEIAKAIILTYKL